MANIGIRDSEQLELQGMPRPVRRKGVKKEEQRGRWGILVLLMVTTLLSLLLYLKNRVGKIEVKFDLPQLPIIGTQTVTFEK